MQPNRLRMLKSEDMGVRMLVGGSISHIPWWMHPVQCIKKEYQFDVSVLCDAYQVAITDVMFPWTLSWFKINYTIWGDDHAMTLDEYMLRAKGFYKRADYKFNRDNTEKILSVSNNAMECHREYWLLSWFHFPKMAFKMLCWTTRLRWCCN